MVIFDALIHFFQFKSYSFMSANTCVYNSKGVSKKCFYLLTFSIDACGDGPQNHGPCCQHAARHHEAVG